MAWTTRQKEKNRDRARNLANNIQYNKHLSFWSSDFTISQNREQISVKTAIKANDRRLLTRISQQFKVLKYVIRHFLSINFKMAVSYVGVMDLPLIWGRSRPLIWFLRHFIIIIQKSKARCHVQVLSVHQQRRWYGRIKLRNICLPRSVIPNIAPSITRRWPDRLRGASRCYNNRVSLWSHLPCHIHCHFSTFSLRSNR